MFCGLENFRAVKQWDAIKIPAGCFWNFIYMYSICVETIFKLRDVKCGKLCPLRSQMRSYREPSTLSLPPMSDKAGLWNKAMKTAFVFFISHDNCISYHATFIVFNCFKAVLIIYCHGLCLVSTADQRIYFYIVMRGFLCFTFTNINSMTSETC